MFREKLASLKTNDEKEAFILASAVEKINSSDYSGVLSLVTSLQDNWDGLTMARLTKVIRRIFDHIPVTTTTYREVLQLLDGLIKWAENKKMLRIELECKQIHVYLNAGLYTECFERIAEILPELKKYDDRLNIIAVHIYESRAYYEIRDLSKAKSALTSARALAVRTACPAYLQGQIDLLNGMYLSDEKAYDTSLSYFIESVEAFVQDKMYANARVALRYIILNKITSEKTEEIPYVLDSKYAAKIKDDEYVQLLVDVSKAHKKRNLKLYDEILRRNKLLVESDPYIYRHLQRLYDLLLDRNILKLIEPYSHVRIDFIAEKLGFTPDVIEDKLRKMILDGAINGILDHSTQCLLVFQAEEDTSYDPIPDFDALISGMGAE